MTITAAARWLVIIAGLHFLEIALREKMSEDDVIGLKSMAACVWTVYLFFIDKQFAAFLAVAAPYCLCMDIGPWRSKLLQLRSML